MLESLTRQMLLTIHSEWHFSMALRKPTLSTQHTVFDPNGRDITALQQAAIVRKSRL
jgi:hypothetical protein